MKRILAFASFMFVGNWHNGFFPLGASVLFLSANVWAFVYNRVKKGV